jgi:hypothetical protein
VALSFLYRLACRALELVRRLDLLLVVSRRHLERILRRYVRHYNAARPHRGLSLMMPIARSEPNVDAVVRRHSVLGGIIHEYERAA